MGSKADHTKLVDCLVALKVCDWQNDTTEVVRPPSYQSTGEPADLMVRYTAVGQQDDDNQPLTPPPTYSSRDNSEH